MFRLYLTRLILPILFVAGMVAIPFVWLPDVTPQPEKTSAAQKTAGMTDKKNKRATPFQKAMTIGFALILVSVTGGRLHALPHHPLADGELAATLRSSQTTGALREGGRTTTESRPYKRHAPSSRSELTPNDA